MAALTRTQRAALAALRKYGRQWPVSRAGVQYNGRTAQYSARTLRALVDAGLARYATAPGSGVMPYYVPTAHRED